MVTVSEYANSSAIPTYYIRPYRVYGTPPPAFTVAPCPLGLVSVTVTDAVYDRYEATVGAGLAQAIGRNQRTSLPVPAGAGAVTVRGFYNVPNFPCTGQNTQPIPARPLSTWASCRPGTPIHCSWPTLVPPAASAT